MAESSLGSNRPALVPPAGSCQPLVGFHSWARRPSTGSLLHRAKYLNSLNPNAAPPPQLSLSPLRCFSQGPSHHRSPLTTIIFSLSLYQHHRYQLQYFHSQPRCRSLRLRNYSPFVSFALTDAHHSFWVHNAPSAFPNLTVFLLILQFSIQPCPLVVEHTFGLDA